MKSTSVYIPAAPPEPAYGTGIIVDGNYSEWNLVNDFFANMYNGGNNNGKLQLTSKAYLRYDSSTSTLYILVLSDPAGPTDAPTGIPTITSTNDAWIAIDDINVKAPFTNFAWINIGYDGNPNHARGYEASIQLSYPKTYNIIIHAEVVYGTPPTDSTSATFGNGWFIPLVLNPPVIIENPSINIVKLTNGTDGPIVLVGDPITWTYNVTNTGDVTLTKIYVTDDKLGDIGTIDSLDPGATKTLISTGTATEGQHNNLATAYGTSPANAVVSSSDGSSYFGAIPSISIDKKTNGTDGPIVLVGDPITWTYKVTNTGNVTLTGINVSDDILGYIGTVASLVPGATASFARTSPATEGEYNNLATAYGMSPVGLAVSDTDTSSYFGANPSIKIVKKTNGEDAPIVLVGQSITWTYDVTNTGNVTLTNIDVSDNKLGYIGTIPSLDPGATTTLASTGTASIGQYINSATAYVTPPVGPDISDIDTSSYFGANPSIKIDKKTNGEDGPIVLVGESITWSYDVTNTGNITLTNIDVSDDNLGYIGTIDSLDPGITTTLTKTGYATEGQYNNTATATASNTPPVGPISDTDTSSYFGANPSINIVKYISVDGGTTWIDANIQPLPQTLVGNTILYKFVVTNNGNVDLDNVILNDVKLNINNIIGTLLKGNSYEFISSPLVAVYGFNTNTAIATGHFINYNGEDIERMDSDSATYFGTLVTYTQGGYQGTGTPGQILNNNFTKYFPYNPPYAYGLTIGKYSPNNASPYGFSWNDVTKLKAFLGSGGTSSALTEDLLNPTTSKKNNYGGTLARQTVTLTLNITFSGNITGMPAGLGNLTYVNPASSLNGFTVNQILDVTNNALATGTLPKGYTFGSLNTLITQINQGFDNGIATPWAQQYLK